MIKFVLRLTFPIIQSAFLAKLWSGRLISLSQSLSISLIFLVILGFHLFGILVIVVYFLFFILETFLKFLSSIKIN